MIHKEKFFGTDCYVKKNVIVGTIPIHPGDTVQQQLTSSRTLFSLIFAVREGGELIPYQSLFASTVIQVGTKVKAVYCPHDD